MKEQQMKMKDQQRDTVIRDDEDVQDDWWNADNPVLDEILDEQQKRQEYARKVVNEEVRDKLNNHRWFDPASWSDTTEMDNLIEAVGKALPAKVNKKRRIHLRVVLANLLKAWAYDETQYIAYHRKHRRYSDLPVRLNPAGMTKLVSKVVDDLSESGFIEHHQGRYSVDHSMGFCSKMRCTAELISLLEPTGFIPGDMIQRHPGAELIVLKSSKGTNWQNGKVAKTGGGLLDYEDTPEIRQMRGKLMAYNAFLQKHDIRLPGSLSEPKAKTLHRTFNNGSWEEGGRYAGGWWINQKEEARACILIDGKPTVELDYGSSLLRVLYALNGACPDDPQGDLYGLPGFHREAVKKLSMRCLSNKRKHSVISGTRSDLEEKSPEIAQETNTELLVKIFEEKHKAVAHDFYKGMIHVLQYRESEMCSRIIMGLMEEDICCLPIYDSFIVQKEHEDRLRTAMISAFRDEMGVGFDPVIK